MLSCLHIDSSMQHALTLAVYSNQVTYIYIYVIYNIYYTCDLYIYRERERESVCSIFIIYSVVMSQWC